MRPPRCEKVKYPSREAALGAMRSQWGKGWSTIRVYPCGKHNTRCWHHTSRPKTR